MSNEQRRDVALGDLSALDGIPAGPAVGAATADRPPEPASLPRARTAGRERALLVPALAVALCVLLALVVYLLVIQRGQSAALAALEARAQASVATLADQVSTTSNTLQSADSQTQQALDRLAAELRRLDKSLATQARQQEATAVEARALGAELQRVTQADQQADGQRDARLKTLADTLDALAVRQKTLADGMARLERSSGELAQLRTALNLLEAELRETRQEFDRRLRAGEQATASIDAFRRQVNATLDRLNQQVTELYQRR